MTPTPAPMRYAALPPLGREVSRLVLGTGAVRDDGVEAALDLIDRWVAVGGNAIDCAHEYGGGAAERAVGRWLAERGGRGRLLVMTKGAHPYDGRRRVRPEDVTTDLRESLDRLGVEVIDVLMLHRDDPSVPVGPLVEVLNEHREAGRIRAFGASNWSTDRLDEAQAYAVAHGLEPFCCSSSQLSLAVQNEPAYEDTVSAGDAASRAWYARTGLPLLAWSSQAAGFFTDAYRPGQDTPGLLERVYGGAANLERRRRAASLARDRGRTPNQVALAWVLHQPFPTYAIVGPRTIEELDSSVAALDIGLSGDEVRWLNVEAER